MGKIKGQNLRIFVGGSVVAQATSCTINLNGETEDSSHKDISGDFARPAITQRSWSVSVDSLKAETATVISYLNMIVNKTAVTLKWDQTSGSSNSTPVGADFSKTGSAYLTDFTLATPNRQNSTVTLQFTGNGKISSSTTS